MHTLSNITSYIPADLDFLSALKFIAIFAAAVLLIGAAGRMILGKRSGLNHSVSSAMGILCIYALTIVVYTFNPWDMSKFLTPLPFVTFDNDVLYLFSFANMEITDICTQILSMIILAFLVNLLDGFLPKGEKLLTWYIWRFLTVLLAMALHYIVTWIFNTFLPGALVTYAPTILVGILFAMLVLSVLNVILGLVLTVVNPLFGAVYGFFFSNIVGKQLGKAVMTTLLLCAVVLALNHFGYALISISAAALQAYIPFIAALLVLWYVIGHIL